MTKNSHFLHLIVRRLFSHEKSHEIQENTVSFLTFISHEKHSHEYVKNYFTSEARKCMEIFLNYKL